MDALIARGGVELNPTDRIVHPSGIVPVIQNIVATVSLGVQLDLKKIALEARNAEYNPRRFAACIMRIRDPKTTCLVFGSGKLVVTGARSEDLARTAVLAHYLFLNLFDSIGHKKWPSFHSSVEPVSSFLDELV